MCVSTHHMISHVVAYIQVLQLTKLAKFFKNVFIEILKVGNLMKHILPTYAWKHERKNNHLSQEVEEESYKSKSSTEMPVKFSISPDGNIQKGNKVQHT